MKTALLAIRCGLEGVLGFLLMLVVLVDLPKAIISLQGAENKAYACGMVLGTLIMGCLGYYIFRDAIKVGRRIRKVGTFKEPVLKSSKPLSGIGGWLLLLIIKLCIGALVRILGGFGRENHFLGITEICMGILAGTSAYLLGSENARGIVFAKIYLLLDALYYSYVLILGFGLSGDNGSYPLWFKPSGFLLSSLLYVAYLSRSERVKNTYFPPAVHVEPESEPNTLTS